jgi:hypothetical protein
MKHFLCYFPHLFLPHLPSAFLAGLAIEKERSQSQREARGIWNIYQLRLPWLQDPS